MDTGREYRRSVNNVQYEDEPTSAQLSYDDSEDSEIYENEERVDDAGNVVYTGNILGIEKEKIYKFFKCLQVSRKYICRCFLLFLSYLLILIFLILFLAGYFEAKYFDTILSYLLIAVVGVLFVLIFTLFPCVVLITIEERFEFFKIVKERAAKEYVDLKKKYDKTIKLPPPRMTYFGVSVYFFVTVLILGIMLHHVFVGKITANISGDSFLVFLLIFTLILLYIAAIYLIEISIKFLYWIWVKHLTGIKIKIILATTFFSITIWSFYSITVYRFETAFFLGLGFALCPGIAVGMIPVIILELVRVIILTSQVLRGKNVMQKILKGIKRTKRPDEDESDNDSENDSDEDDSEEDSEEERKLEKRRRRREKIRRIQKQLREQQRRELREQLRKMKMEGADFSTDKEEVDDDARQEIDDMMDSSEDSTEVIDVRRDIEEQLGPNAGRGRPVVFPQDEIEGERKLVNDDSADLSEFHRPKKRLLDSEDASGMYEGGVEIDEDEDAYQFHSEGEMGEYGRKVQTSDDDEHDENVGTETSRIEGEDEDNDDYAQRRAKGVQLIFRCFYVCLYVVICFFCTLGLIFVFVVAFSQNFESFTFKRSEGLIDLKNFKEKYPDLISTEHNPSTLTICQECTIKRYIYGSRNCRRSLYQYIEDDPDPDQKEVKYTEYYVDERGKRKNRKVKTLFKYSKKWKSDPVNLEGIVKISSVRHKITNITEKTLPLNAMVWHPVSAVVTQKFPIVVVMHGDYPMLEHADEKFIWLGEFLAKQGYIAVVIDVSFLNSQLNFFPSEQDINDESGLDTRALMVLYHLKFIKEKLCNEIQDENLDPNIVLRVDWDRIALIGHSKGGQGMMAVDELNKVNLFPRNGVTKLEVLDLQFKISAYITLAPTFIPYEFHGSKLKGKNINHLMIWGGRDTTVLNPEGLEYFSNIEFDSTPNTNANQKPKYRKCFVYIDGANHGHFASQNVDTFGFGKYLTSQSVISFYDQMETARVYIGAFLNDIFQNETRYTDFLRDPRVGFDWLPKKTIKESGEEVDIYPSYLINQYEDDRFWLLAGFSEDRRLDTTTERNHGGVITAKDFKSWSEGKLVATTNSKDDTVTRNVGLDIDAVFLKVGSGDTGIYSIEFSKALDVRGYKYLAFMLADNVVDRLKGVWSNNTVFRPTVYVKVAKFGDIGELTSVQIDGRLPPREYIEKIKFSYDFPPLVLQSYFIPFSEFYKEEKLTSLGKIVFEIKGREQEHAIIISRIGLTK